MGRPAESRNTVRHLLNVRLPYSYENPNFQFINEGVTELTESYEVDDDDIQYIGEKNKTTNIKGISRSFELSMGYIQDDPIQNWINLVLRVPQTGAQSMCDYVRFNILEPMYGTKNQYIGVRSRATVQPASIGGAASDSMTSVVNIKASGDPLVGYVTVDNTTSDNPIFTWTNAELEAPIITSPTHKSKVSGATVTIEGTGTPGYYVVVYYGMESTDKTAPILVSSSGNWTTTIEAVKLGKSAKIAAIIYEKNTMTGKQSVSSVPVSFTTEAASLEPPVITAPTNNATGVAVNSKIKGTGKSGATVTVNSSSKTLGQATVDESGNWEITPNEAFSAATQYTINATQRLGASTSKPSESVAFTTA